MSRMIDRLSAIDTSCVPGGGCMYLLTGRKGSVAVRAQQTLKPCCSCQCCAVLCIFACVELLGAGQNGDGDRQGTTRDVMLDFKVKDQEATARPRDPTSGGVRRGA